MPPGQASLAKPLYGLTPVPRVRFLIPDRVWTGLASRLMLSLVSENGSITMSLTGKKLDAANLSEASKTPIDQLLAFKHVGKPKSLPLAELVALFELLRVGCSLTSRPVSDARFCELLLKPIGNPLRSNYSRRLLSRLFPVAVLRQSTDSQSPNPGSIPGSATDSFRIR
jgi:hypothetical protein